MLRFALVAVFLGSSLGCQLIPDVAHQPVVHNPFPQLSRVAVAPFFNHSDDETVDGRQFALAYYGALQEIQGFEVVPLSVVEETMLAHQISLNDPDGARRLAEILGVDAVVVGAVTDYSPYYPPRCGLRVEWYAANPGFHEIPPGYGLPWGTPDEEFIPAPLVFDAEMAFAKEQLKTQTPACVPLAASGNNPVEAEPRFRPTPVDEEAAGDPENADLAVAVFDPFAHDDAIQLAQTVQTAPIEEPIPALEIGEGLSCQEQDPMEPSPSCPPSDGVGEFPTDWPDARGFIPRGPSPVRPPCCPSSGPVMTHTRIYSGNNGEFTQALANYYQFRDDARFGGWQSYLQRSDDFIRFCCHLHISEMLAARGGGGETRVLWRWSESR